MSDDGQQFFAAAVAAWMAEPEAIPKLVSTNYRLHCENAALTAQLAAVTAERDALREAAEDAATIIESMSRRVVGVDLAGKVLRAALAARGGEAS